MHEQPERTQEQEGQRDHGPWQPRRGRAMKVATWVVLAVVGISIAGLIVMMALTVGR